MGLQLLTAEGPSIVRWLVGQGKKVFLDLKLHEIPNSVASAVTVAGSLGASMVTVHASGGSAVLRAAVKAAEPFPQLQVLAVTVITSMAEQDLAEIGVHGSVLAQVERLAALAAAAGCHGVVASAQEAARLRQVLPARMLIVVKSPQAHGSKAKPTPTKLVLPRLHRPFRQVQPISSWVAPLHASSVQLPHSHLSAVKLPKLLSTAIVDAQPSVSNVTAA